jgi:hypothetical protein
MASIAIDSFVTFLSELPVRVLYLDAEYRCRAASPAFVRLNTRAHQVEGAPGDDHHHASRDPALANAE